MEWTRSARNVDGFTLASLFDILSGVYSNPKAFIVRSDNL
jgi:hypothetical protein